MTIDIIRPKQSKYAFFVRTQDRIDILKETLPTVFYEEGVDFYWIDGSKSEEAREYVRTQFRDSPNLTEVHTNIDTGRAGSFLYGAKVLLQRQYDYIGSIDCEVKCELGWFKKLLWLLEKGKEDGLKVAGVSARCFWDRLLIPRDDYAVMSDVGGGMVMYRYEDFLEILGHQTTCLVHNTFYAYSDFERVFKDCTGLDYPVPLYFQKELKKENPAPKSCWGLSNDWWWGAIMISQGKVLLACTPTMAMDLPNSGWDLSFEVTPQETATKADTDFDWKTFTERLNQRFIETRAV